MATEAPAGQRADWEFVPPLRIAAQIDEIADIQPEYTSRGLEIRRCPDGDPRKSGVFANNFVPRCRIYPIIGRPTTVKSTHTYGHATSGGGINMVCGDPHSWPDDSVSHTIALTMMVNMPLKGSKERVNCIFWNGCLVTTRNIEEDEELLVDYAYGPDWNEEWSPAEHQLNPDWGTDDNDKPRGQPSKLQCDTFRKHYQREEMQAALDGTRARIQTHWSRTA